MIQQNDTACAACGGPIVHLAGEEFCSTECFQAGRAFCKTCGKPLTQHAKGRRVNYCNTRCRKGYRKFRNRESLRSSRDQKRSTCKACGKPITQHPSMRTERQFCSARCGSRFRRAQKRGSGLLLEWGTFRPETRKSLQEVQQFIGIGAANRLATAISREYVPRVADNPNTKIICHCKTCGKEFHRMSWGYQSREYCTPTCNPSVRVYKKQCGEHNAAAKLTWEQVDEIRHLYAAGGTSLRKLGVKYSITDAAIGRIVKYENWKPENDPRPR